MPKSIGSLWIKTKNGKEYLDGYIEGKRVVIFKNDYKKGNQPDYKIFPKISQTDKPDNEVPF